MNLTDKKKMGRPTSDPKTVKLTVRINEETNKTLEEYCKNNSVSKADGVREAISRLK